MGELQRNTAKTRGAENVNLHLNLHLLPAKIHQNMPGFAKNRNPEMLENTRF